MVNCELPAMIAASGLPPFRIMEFNIIPAWKLPSSKGIALVFFSHISNSYTWLVSNESFLNSHRYAGTCADTVNTPAVRINRKNLLRNIFCLIFMVVGFSKRAVGITVFFSG